MALDSGVNSQSQAFIDLRDKLITAKGRVDAVLLSLDDLASHYGTPKYLSSRVAAQESECNGWYGRLVALRAALDSFLGLS